MSEHRWIRVTRLDDLPLNEGRVAVIGHREVAVFRLRDGVFATDNRCPHKAGPLCDGVVTGSSVVCPLHAWKVNLATGEVERPAAGHGCIQAYPTRVEEGVVLVGLRADVDACDVRPQAGAACIGGGHAA